MHAVNFSAKLAALAKQRKPRVAAQFTGSDVSAVSVTGESVRHEWADTGEFAGLARRRLTSALLAGPLAGLAHANPHVEQQFPDIVAVKVRAAGTDLFDFDVTVSSPYDTPARYADGFRVATLSGQVLGERKLLHDHQDEQPFTRDLHGLRIDKSIKRVVVQGRDQRFGYGGRSFQVTLPGR